jgi:hypothetical protein
MAADFCIRFKIGSHVVYSTPFKLVSSCSQLPPEIRDNVRPSKKSGKGTEDEEVTPKSKRTHLEKEAEILAKEAFTSHSITQHAVPMQSTIKGLNITSAPELAPPKPTPPPPLLPPTQKAAELKSVKPETLEVLNYDFFRNQPIPHASIMPSFPITSNSVNLHQMTKGPFPLPSQKVSGPTYVQNYIIVSNDMPSGKPMGTVISPNPQFAFQGQVRPISGPTLAVNPFGLPNMQCNTSHNAAVNLLDKKREELEDSIRRGDAERASQLAMELATLQKANSK